MPALDAGRGRERLNAGARLRRRRQDNPAAAIVCLPREGERGSGESQINLSFSTFLLSPASLPSLSQSTMEEVSRLACSTIRKGITFTHFLRQRKWERDENVSGSENFFFLTNPWVIEVPGKEAFLCPVKFTWREARFARGEHQNKQTLITNTTLESSYGCICYFFHCSLKWTFCFGSCFYSRLKMPYLELSSALIPQTNTDRNS